MPEGTAAERGVRGHAEFRAATLGQMCVNTAATSSAAAMGLESHSESWLL